MSNILVAVDGTGTNAHVMEAAIERAEREDGSLVVVHVIPTAEYEARQRAVRSIGGLTNDGFTYGITQARDEARDIADRAAREAIGTRAVPYTAVGAVGKLVPMILASAAEHGAETVVLGDVGSWWRRLLGRSDRKMTRGFDGAIVRVPRPAAPTLELERPAPRA